MTVLLIGCLITAAFFLIVSICALVLAHSIIRCVEGPRPTQRRHLPRYP
jgi:hypothetical protein